MLIFQITIWLFNHSNYKLRFAVPCVVGSNPGPAKKLIWKNFFLQVSDKLMSFDEQKDDLTDKIDFIVCLGGDGTLLYASSLFQQSVPPVMAFHLGSLGFLTPFEFENFEQQVTQVLEGKSTDDIMFRMYILMKRDI